MNYNAEFCFFLLFLHIFSRFVWLDLRILISLYVCNSIHSLFTVILHDSTNPGSYSFVSRAEAVGPDFWLMFLPVAGLNRTSFFLFARYYSTAYLSLAR